MKPLDDRLLDLAASVADGQDVDWDDAERSTLDLTEHHLIGELRTLAEIFAVHRGFQIASEEGKQRSEVSRWGNLELLGRVGVGSFGEVNKARDPQLDRIVALKLLRRRGTDPADAIVREGRLLARVKHPNVATVYGADQRDGQVGLWMEFLEGRTLSELLQEQGPFGARETTLVGMDLCRAVAAVHGQGIVHRDIKAQNVMREQGGRIVLTDFGIGLDLAEKGREEATLSGTPLYLAPEIFAGAKATVRSDVYSLGVLLYHLVTGGFPVHGRSLEEVQSSHERGDRTFLRDARPDLPSVFVEVVERALEPDPAQRFATTGELEKALAGVLVGAEVVGRARTWRYRASWAAASLLLFVLSAYLLSLTFLEPVTTHSFKARLRYSEALRLYDRGRVDEAVSLWKTSVELDPDFAMAHRWLAKAQSGLGLFQEALESSTRAFELRERVSELERYHIEGTYHTLRKDHRRAIGVLQAILALEAATGETYRQLALLYEDLGLLDEAINAAIRAQDIDREDVKNSGLLVILLAEANRYDDAMEWFQSARREHKDHPYLFWGAGLAELGKGNTQKSREAFQRLMSGDGFYREMGQLLLAQTLIYSGELEEATRLLEIGLTRDVVRNSDYLAANRILSLSRIDILQGRRSSALLRVKSIEALPDLPTYIASLKSAGLIYAELGDTAATERILVRLEDTESRYPSLVSATAVAHIRGELAWAGGDLELAREELEKASQLRTVEVVWSQARFWEGQKDWERAAKSYEEVLARKGEALNQELSAAWVLAHLHLAHCQEELGDPRSVSYRAAFLKLWDEKRLSAMEGIAGGWITSDPDR